MRWLAPSVFRVVRMLGRVAVRTGGPRCRAWRSLPSPQLTPEAAWVASHCQPHQGGETCRLFHVAGPLPAHMDSESTHHKDGGVGW